MLTTAPLGGGVFSQLFAGDYIPLLVLGKEGKGHYTLKNY